MIGRRNMNKTTGAYEQGNLRRKAQEERPTFFDAFDKETDRGLAIVSVCFLDNMLEKLIRAVYRKDPRIKILFKDNQILQSFYNKVCIAYFSGLIPELFNSKIIEPTHHQSPSYTHASANMETTTRCTTTILPSHIRHSRIKNVQVIVCSRSAHRYFYLRSFDRSQKIRLARIP